MSNKRRNLFITGGSIAGLILGVLGGLLLRDCQLDACPGILLYSEIFGKIWILILFAMALPLVSAIVISTILGLKNVAFTGKLTGISLILHLAIYITGIFFSIGFGYFLIGSLIPYIPRIAEVSYLPDIDTPDHSIQITATNWILQNVESGTLALSHIFIYLFISLLVAAFVISKFHFRIQDQVQRFSQASANYILRIFNYFLVTMPVGVFFLIMPLFTKTGFQSISMVVYFILLVIVLLIIFTIFLHILVYFKGSVSLKNFIKSMLPCNLIAMSSRSSIATIPALMYAAEKNLKIPPAIVAIVIPFFVSVFRLNTCISGPFKLIFLSYVFGIPLNFPTVILFCLALLFISFGSPGIPSGSKLTGLAIYLAAGIPVEGYLLVKFADAIPDIFKTNLNVTHTLALTTITARIVGIRGFELESAKLPIA